MRSVSLAPYFDIVERVPAIRRQGEVTALAGLLVESSGPAAAIGDFCEIQTSAGGTIRVQVIGFRNGKVLSMPLEEIDGLRLGDKIVARGEGGEGRGGQGAAWPRPRRVRETARWQGPVTAEASYGLYTVPPGPSSGNPSAIRW